MKTIFITGASSGLGKATAKLFAQNGWKVIATMRNPEKETELSKIENIALLPLDVSDLNQIKSTAAKALSLFDVDVVFNNAGYILVGPLEGTDDEQLLRQINTNLLGAIRVTQAFIPHFRKKKSGLFLTTTSLNSLIPEPLSSIYRATKAGLEGWSEAMTFELSKFNIGIKTIVPGYINTGLAGSAEIASHEAYTDLLNKLVSVYTRPEAVKGASEPDQIAQVVFEAATDGKDQTRYLAGEDANYRYAQLQKLGTEATRKATSQMFFG